MNIEGIELDDTAKICRVAVYSLNQMAFVGDLSLAFSVQDDEIYCHMTEMPDPDDDFDIFFIKGFQLHPEDHTVYELRMGSEKLEPSRFDESKLETFIYKL